MNINRHIRFCSAILFAFLCLASSRAADAPALKVDAVPGHASPFISVFNDTARFGKDPFFPKSMRREQRTPVLATNLVLQPGELPPGMVLKGISGTKDKPLAIINNYTFATGEEAELRIGNALYR